MRIWGSVGIAPHILKFCSRWRSLVSFTPWPLLFRERASGAYRIWVWMCPRYGLDAVEKRKNPTFASAGN